MSTVNPGPAILSRNNNEGVLYDPITGNIFAGGTILGTNFGSPAGTLLSSIANFGVFSSPTLDQTDAIQSAITQAHRLGLSLYWPPGVYVYSKAITNSVSWFGAGSGLVEMRKVTSLGKGALITTSSSNVTVQGFTFTSPNTPTTAQDDATPSDGCMFFNFCSSITVDSNVFRDQYGVVVLFSTVTNSIISNNRGYSFYHDGFHLTGGCIDIVRYNNYVEDAGDDVFPAVGYNDGARNERIFDVNNTVIGSKWGRCFAYVGTKSVQNVGCRVDGTIPAQYNRAATLQSTPAMYIASETGTFSTWGNQDVQVVGFKAVNCGRGSSPFTAIVNAVTVTGSVNEVSNNIRFTNLTIKDSAGIGFFANGGVSGGINGLYLDGVQILNTSDPNGWITTAGTSQFAGATVKRVNDFRFDGVLADTGASGITFDNTSTGECDLKVKSYRINVAAKTGAVRIVDMGNSNSILSRLKIDLFIADQTAATSGNAGYVDRAIFATAPGVIESLRFEQANEASVGNIAILPGSYASVSVTASPMTYSNVASFATTPAVTGVLGPPQLVLVNAGTATDLVINRGRTGAFSSVNVAPATGGLRTYTLAPGEQLLITYTTAGSMSIQTTPCSGI